MTILITFLKILHIVTAILMAWPFYALVAVNQRGRLGSPLGDRVDILLENTIKNRTLPCFIFQATVMVSGLALVLLRGLGLGALLSNPALGLKFLLLLFISGLLVYVHLRLQPAIDRLFAANSPISKEIAGQIQILRLRRKRLSSICMFSVLTMAMLGVQVYTPLPLWFTLVLLGLIAAFTWRAYSSQMSYGWL